MVLNEIVKHIKGLYFGGNWTSVNVKDTIKDITLSQAKTKVSSLNTIAVLVYHINYYVEGILPVFKGGTLNIKDKFSFNAPNFSSEEEWEYFKESVLKNAELLISKIEKLSSEQLFQFFVDEKYGTYYRNLHGIIEHTHYHLGQIVIVKKLIIESKNDKRRINIES